MQIKTISSPWSSLLQRAYYQSSDAVQSLLEYPPFADESYQRRLAYLDHTEDMEHRHQLVDVIQSYHEPELLHPAVKENLQKLRKKGSVAVIGGQQAGLLTGPLFTIHKIINMIILARREERRLGRSVIPVFWIAGEDHDREEVDHIWTRSRTGEPKKHRLKTTDSNRKIPISSRMITRTELDSWLKEIAYQLPDTEYKKEWLQEILSLHNTGPLSWSRFFARILHFLFGEYGLLCIDSAYPPLRDLERPFFHRLLEKSHQLNQSIQHSIQELENKGFSTTLHIKEQQGLLFLEENGERKTLFRSRDQWTTREGTSYWTTEQLKSRASDLSNNVATRPLMQEYVFPTLAYVTGVGELSYWSCLRSSFRIMGIEMPILFPRTTFTLLEPHIQKRMEQLDLSIHSLANINKEKEKWIIEQTQIELAPLFTEAKQKLDHIYQPLILNLQEKLGVNMETIGEVNHRKAEKQLQFLQEYAERIWQTRKDSEIKRWDEVIHALEPNAESQERVYNLIEYWNRYGLSWIAKLLDQPLLAEDDQHQVILIH